MAFRFRKLWGDERVVNTGLSTVAPTRGKVNQILVDYWLSVRGEMSQENFAALIGIPKATIGFIERGDRRITSDHLERLAKVQGKSPERMLGEIAELSLVKMPRSGGRK